MSNHDVCPSCGTEGLSIFYEVNGVPVNSCVLLSTKKEALNFPLGDVILGFCNNCGFITNVAFEQSKVDYSSTYEDQQCFSPTFNAFANRLANQLIKKFNLNGKRILEIGCGKGDFLTLLCELGQNYGVGIDPSYKKNRMQSKASGRITFIPDYYSDRYADYTADFVCCRHTLEHIPDTYAFMNTIRTAIGNHQETSVFLEVPDVIRVLTEVAFWDIYYEHCSYFSLGSLARLFRYCNFEVIDLCRDFNDQYILLEAKPVIKKSFKIHNLEDSVNEAANCVDYFTKHYQEKIDFWKNRLNQFHTDGKKVIVWGSGSKCVSFLTTLKVEQEIEYIVDVNPYREGKFIPGAAKRIMAPCFLKKYNPDYVIVMNSAYCNEIKKAINDMEVRTEVLTI